MQRQSFVQVVLSLARRLRGENRHVEIRCNALWRRRVRTMSRSELCKEFQWLLSGCGPRKIALLFRLIFRHSFIALRETQQDIRRRGFQNMQQVSEIVNFDNTEPGGE